jgi:hypothetical protein
MRLTDEELETLLTQINAPRPVREKVATVRANGHLTYPVLSAIVGIRQNTLEVKVHRLRQRRHREAQRLPDLSGPRETSALVQLIRGKRHRPDHGPRQGRNRYTGQWEEAWDRSPYPNLYELVRG